MSLSIAMRRLSSDTMWRNFRSLHAALASLFVSIIALATLSFPAIAGPYDVAVIIGNQNYAPPIPTVEFARRDAKAMRLFAIDVLGIKESNVIAILDAKQSEMLNVFGSSSNPKGRLFQYVRDSKSNVFVFYSGHGVPGPETRRNFLLPVDSDPDFAEMNGYPIGQLYKNLSQIGAKSVQVYIDACFSGQSAGGPLIKAASPVILSKKEPVIPEGITVITAAMGNQLANWDLDARHGLFTNYFLEGVYGAADKNPHGNGDSKVSLKELQTWLNEEMSYVAKRKFRRNQTSFVYGHESTIVASLPSGKKLIRPKIKGSYQNNSSNPINRALSDKDFKVHSPIIFVAKPQAEGTEMLSIFKELSSQLERVGKVVYEGATLNGLETIVKLEMLDVLFDEGVNNNTQASQVLQQILGNQGGTTVMTQSTSVRAQANVRIVASSQVNGAYISVEGTGNGIATSGSRKIAKRKAVREAVSDGAKKLSGLLDPYFAEYASRQ